MKFGEELKFLGGLYNAIKDKYPTNETNNIFEEKIQLSVKKDIKSKQTANQIKNLFFDNKEQDVENLIDSIMNDDFNVKNQTSKIDAKTFGNDLIHIGKLYSSIEQESEKSFMLDDYSLEKTFTEKIGVLVDRKIISPYVGSAIVKIVENKEIDNLIEDVMNEPTKTKAPTRTPDVDPCGHSFFGRSPC